MTTTESELTHGWWKALLLLTKTVESYAGPVEVCSLKTGNTPEVRINGILSPSEDAHTVTVYLDSEPDTAGEEGTWVKVSHFIQVTPTMGENCPGMRPAC